MKARLIPPPKKAICYHLEHHDAVLAVLKEAGAIPVFAGDEELPLLCEEVLAKDLGEYTSGIFKIDSAFLALSGFFGKDFDRILEKLKLADPKRQVLKAVITEHNRKWTLEKLITEVEKEHQEFLKREQEEKK